MVCVAAVRCCRVAPETGGRFSEVTPGKLKMDSGVSAVKGKSSDLSRSTQSRMSSLCCDGRMQWACRNVSLRRSAVANRWRASLVDCSVSFASVKSASSGVRRAGGVEPFPTARTIDGAIHGLANLEVSRAGGSGGNISAAVSAKAPATEHSRGGCHGHRGARFASARHRRSCRVRHQLTRSSSCSAVWLDRGGSVDDRSLRYEASREENAR